MLCYMLCYAMLCKIGELPAKTVPKPCPTTDRSSKIGQLVRKTVPKLCMSRVPYRGKPAAKTVPKPLRAASNRLRTTPNKPRHCAPAGMETGLAEKEKLGRAALSPPVSLSWCWHRTRATQFGTVWAASSSLSRTVLARFWRRARRFWTTPRGRPHRGVEGVWWIV